MHADDTATSKRSPIDTHELAWAAGFFDGEGTTCITRYTPKNQHKATAVISVGISQVNPELLYRFKRAVRGLGIINGPYVPPSYGRNQQPQYRYRASGFERAQAIVAMLWPWLGSTKREQAKTALLTMRAEWAKPGRQRQETSQFCKRGHDQGIHRHVQPSGSVVCKECQRIQVLAAFYRRKGDHDEAQRVMDGTHVSRKGWRRKDRPV